MKKSSILKRISVCAVAAAMSATVLFAGCGGGSEEIIIDLGSIMPTTNTVSTAENPEVIQSTKTIMDKYAQEKGITYKWAKEYGRNAGDSVEDMTSWYNRQINTGICPIIGSTSNNTLAHLDYYVPLDEYITKVNPYTGNVWKNDFYDYVWEDAQLYNYQGQLIAIPIVLGVGSLTGVFYDKGIFEDYNASVPTNWLEYKNLMDGTFEGVDAFHPYEGYKKPGLFQWALMYNLAPNVLKYMTTNPATTDWGIDYNGDGKLTPIETLRGVAEGKFDPRVEGPAREVYKEVYTFYKAVTRDHWYIGSYDATAKWNAGQLAMKEGGLWNIPMESSNSNRANRSYGVFNTPLAGTETFTYAVDVEFYDSFSFENVKNPVSIALNIMKPALNSCKTEEEKQAKIDQAIDILMYLTSVENNTLIAREKGGTMGSVKNSGYNQAIDVSNVRWRDNRFPKLDYSASWPSGFTSEYSGKINDAFEKWFNGTGYSEDKFYNDVYTYQMAGAKAYAQTATINTTGWDVKW